MPLAFFSRNWINKDDKPAYYTFIGRRTFAACNDLHRLLAENCNYVTKLNDLCHITAIMSFMTRGMAWQFVVIIGNMMECVFWAERHCHCLKKYKINKDVRTTIVIMQSGFILFDLFFWDIFFLD